MVDRVILSITISSSKFDDVQVNRYLSFVFRDFLSPLFHYSNPSGPLIGSSEYGFDFTEIIVS